MRKLNPSKDEQIAILKQEREKFRGLFHKAQGMLDHDEIKRLRHIIVRQAAQIKQLEEMRSIAWIPIATDEPIM